MKVFEAVRVLDLTDELGAYAPKLLADLGARVIRVDPPGRALLDRAPYLDADRRLSLFDAFFNQNKQRLTLDLAGSAGRDRLHRLWRACDVLVWSSLDGVNDPRWPVVEGLRGDAGRIVCLISPFGIDGPYRDFVASDAVVMALGGFLGLSGYPDCPVVPFGEQSYYAASLHAVLGILVALRHRQASGEGQEVEVAAQEAVAHALENAAQYADMEGVVRGRTGDVEAAAGTGIFRCKDGYVYLMAFLHGTPLRWPEIVDWLAEAGTEGAECLRGAEWSDPAWVTGEEAKRRFRAVFERFAATRGQIELYEEGQARGVNICPLNTLADCARSPQLRARRFFREGRGPDPDTTLVFPGPPFRIAGETPRPIAVHAAGADNEALAAFGAGPDRTVAPAAAPPADAAPPPLAGVRIVDFTWVGVGPFATKFLADFGADVIKIESARRIDVVRSGRPFAGGRPGVNRSGYFANRNTSKRSITVDLKHPEGLRLVEELVRRADVVINNFSPGVMAKLGLSREAAMRLNPRIVYVDMPMQGIEGPHSGFRGYGAMMNALSGLYAMTGLPGRRPTGTGTNYPDHVPNPLHAAIAILAVLIDRAEGGGGRAIEVSQIESATNVLGPYLMQALNAAAPPEVLGNRHPDGVPQSLFRCADGQWCAVTARTAAQWRRLDALLGLAGNPAPGRAATEETRAALSRWMAARPADAAMAALQKAGIAAGRIEDAREVLRDAQLVHRGHWVYLDHPEMGRTVHDGPVARLSRTPARLRRPAPLLGQHTREVVREELGLAEAAYQTLRANGVFS